MRPSELSDKKIVRRGLKCFLRTVEAEDAASFYRWYCNGKIQQFLANPWWSPGIDFESYRTYRFQQYLQPNPRGGVLVICDLVGDRIGLVNYFDLDSEQKSCEIGIIIGEIDRWRHGFATEALNLLLKFLIDEFSVQSVRARILTENVASLRLFEKVGFELTGETREQDYVFKEYYYFVKQERL